MNHCVPDWNMEDDFFTTTANQKKSMGLDHELVELLWHNGQVVLHSQTHRKPGPTCNDSGQIQKPDRQPSKGGGSFGNFGSLIQEDETASWIQYPLEDSLDKDFCPNFLCELPNSHQIEAEKQNKQFEGDKNVNFGATQENNFHVPSGTPRSQQPGFKQSNNPNVAENPMPPPRLKIPDSVRQDPNMGGANRIVNFSHFSRPIKAELGSLNGLTAGKGSGHVTGGDNGESSVMTIGSSHCGSNQLQNDADLSRVSSNVLGTAGIFAGQGDIQKLFSQCERRHSETLDPTVTSSSGGSGGSFGGTGRQSTSTHSHKRKGRDADESECPSEEAEFESAEANKQTRRSGSSRRSRAAEVHNLSERRRRDRINEKMKALQELIPHCNKSDKASMLDEAIEYLKSLQLQVQLMWMGSGMTPMIFPGVQHYLSRMGMGMGPPPLPSIHNPMQLPRVPLDQATSSPTTPNQPSMFAPPVVNQVNFQNQLQSPNYPESYARYMGFHHMQTAQPMNIFNYGSQTVQQSHKIGGPNGVPCQGGTPSDTTQNCLRYYRYIRRVNYQRNAINVQIKDYSKLINRDMRSEARFN